MKIFEGLDRLEPPCCKDLWLPDRAYHVKMEPSSGPLLRLSFSSDHRDASKTWLLLPRDVSVLNDNVHRHCRRSNMVSAPIQHTHKPLSAEIDLAKMLRSDIADMEGATQCGHTYVTSV